MAHRVETGHNDPRWHFPRTAAEGLVKKEWEDIDDSDDQEALDAGGVTKAKWDTRTPAMRLKLMEDKELIRKEEDEAGINLDDPADSGISLEEDGDSDDESSAEEEDSEEELEALKKKARKIKGGEAREPEEIAALKAIVEKVKGKEITCSICRRKPISTSDARCQYCHAPTLVSVFKKAPSVKRAWDEAGGPDLEDEDADPTIGPLLNELYPKDDFDDLLKDPEDIGEEFNADDFEEVGADFKIGDYAGENLDLEEKIDRYASYKTVYDLPGAIHDAIEKKRVEEKWLINKLEPEREYLLRVFIKRWENDSTPPHKKRRAMLLSIQGTLEAFPEPDSKVGLKKILSSDYDYLRAHMSADQRHLINERLRREAKKYKGYGDYTTGPGKLWNTLNKEQRAKILLDLGILAKGAGKKKEVEETETDWSKYKERCPSCGAMIPITNPELVGKKINCPKCKSRFVVEGPSESEDDEEDEEAPEEEESSTDFDLETGDEEEEDDDSDDSSGAGGGGRPPGGGDPGDGDEDEEEEEEENDVEALIGATTKFSGPAPEGLYDVLRDIGSFKRARDGKRYESEEQIRFIEIAQSLAESVAAAGGEVDFDSIIFRKITNTHGLRDQVRKILEIEEDEGRPEVAASEAACETVKGKLRVPLQDLNDLMLVFAPDLHFASLEKVREAIEDPGFTSVENHEQIVECYILMSGLGDMRRQLDKGGLTVAQVEDADTVVLPDIIKRIAELKTDALAIDSDWKGRENGTVPRLDKALIAYAGDLEQVKDEIERYSRTEFANLPPEIQNLMMAFWNFKYEETEYDWNSASPQESIKYLKFALVSEWGNQAFSLMLLRVDDKKEKAVPVSKIEAGDDVEKMREKLTGRALKCKAALAILQRAYDHATGLGLGAAIPDVPEFLLPKTKRTLASLIGAVDFFLGSARLNEGGPAVTSLIDVDYVRMEEELQVVDSEIEELTSQAKDSDAWFLLLEDDQRKEMETEASALVSLDFDATEDEVWDILYEVMAEHDPAVNTRDLASAQWSTGLTPEEKTSRLMEALRRKRARASAAARKKPAKKKVARTSTAPAAEEEEEEKEESMESQLEGISTLRGLGDFLEKQQPDDGSVRREVINVILGHLEPIILHVAAGEFKQARAVVGTCGQDLVKVKNHRSYRKEYMSWIAKVQELITLAEAEVEAGETVEWYYEATDDTTGEEKSGTVEAATEEEAMEEIKSKGLTPTKLERKKQKAKVAASRKKKAADEKKARVEKKAAAKKKAAPKKKVATPEDEEGVYVWEYEVIDDTGNVSTGTIEAESEEDAIEKLQEEASGKGTRYSIRRLNQKTNWQGKPVAAKKKPAGASSLAPAEAEDKEEEKEPGIEKAKRWIKRGMVIAGTATAVSGLAASTELGLVPTAVILATPLIVRGFWDLGWAALFAPMDFASKGKVGSLTDYFGLPFVEQDALKEFLSRVA